MWWNAAANSANCSWCTCRGRYVCLFHVPSISEYIKLVTLLRIILPWLASQETPSILSKAKVKVRVRVILRLAVYRQSMRLGIKPLETNNQRFFFFKLNSWGNSPYVTYFLTRTCVCLLWICLAFRQVYISHTYSLLLKILPFALHKCPLSVQALQSRSCLSYVSYSTTAA
jgi:hypothetical protein